MYLLILGLLLWVGLHLIPVLPAWRDGLAERIGEMGRKGLVAVGLVLSIFLLARGYKAVGPDYPYWELPGWFNHVVVALMLPAFILFMAPRIPNNLRRVVRHPQLTGFALWAGLHVLVKGDLRAVLLFGGLLAWVVIQMYLSNRRDGDWVKPEAVSGLGAYAVFAVGAAVWAGVLWAHIWAGVSPLGL